MKETLYSRHHSTVVPWLDTGRNESHQKLHTYAVDSAIQLQGTNKVLKEHPPTISDMKQRLNRRQRYTLSQLRSGHCHLLAGLPAYGVRRTNRHLYRLCGITIRCESSVHLHHTPYWLVRSICAFRYLDYGNLVDRPGCGKQQHVEVGYSAIPSR